MSDNLVNDAVPRTSVEYICRKNTVSTNPYEHKYHDKFIQFMDDPEISDFGRWQHSNGFNTALVAVRCDLDKVPSVTPKQPGEDIRAMCGECDAWNQYKNYPHRWIPCTPETMPEKEGRYVCTYTYDGKKDVFMFRFENGDFLVPWYVDAITAWYKPLDPWKGGQNDGET